MIADFKFRFG